MDNNAKTARGEALMLGAITIISLPALGLWWADILGIEVPKGGFWILYGLLALGTLVALPLMPLGCRSAWKEYTLLRRRHDAS
jgi:hypothetical protein